MVQKKLIHLRHVYGYTQKDIAGKLKITPRTYQNKESGKSIFTSDEMFLLSKVFNRKIEDIFLPPTHQLGENENL